MSNSVLFLSRLFYTLIIIVSFGLSGCDKCPNECENGQIKILGQCEVDNNAFLFAAKPDFYCYNDSLVIGFPKDNTVNSGKIFVRRYRYLENKGQGTNWIIGGSSSSHVLKNEFYEQCKDKPEGNITYHTFLVVDGVDKITDATSEVKGKLELRTSQYSEHHHPGVYPPKVVLDSANITLFRLK